ncbi:hypothetical protein V6N13_094051 [Hibiscus sabdariffa]
MQLKFIEETKVFQNSLVQFLTFQFPVVIPFFSTNQAATPPANESAAEPSIGANKMETMHFSSNAASDTFHWNTPFDHRPFPSTQPTATDIPESSHARKRKAPAKGVLTEDVSPTPAAAEEEEHISPQPPKKQRRYHVITTESDTDSSESPAF